MAKIVIVLIFILLVGAGCQIIARDTWQGFYYPDGCLVCDNYIVSPKLKSAGDCVRWAEGMKSNSNNPKDTWECGKNCRWEEGFSICKETFGEEGTGVHY